MGVDAEQTRAWDTSTRAHFCAEAATGAGVTNSAGLNCCSRSSGNVSLCASALSRTGLVAVFAAGEVDSVWWVLCDEACGMLARHQNLIQEETAGQLTSLDWELPYQRRSAVRHQLWTEHSHQSRNTCDPAT